MKCGETTTTVDCEQLQLEGLEGFTPWPLIKGMRVEHCEDGKPQLNLTVIEVTDTFTELYVNNGAYTIYYLHENGKGYLYDPETRLHMLKERASGTRKSECFYLDWEKPLKLEAIKGG